jgi:Flp pilus assembly protein TadB
MKDYTMSKTKKTKQSETISIEELKESKPEVEIEPELEIDEPKEPKLIFKKMGNLLTKLSIKEQLEISIIALAGLCIALVITAVYMVGWMGMSVFMEVMTVINAFFGVIFLLMNLAGMYASYKQIALVESTMGDPMDLLKQLTAIEKTNGNITFQDEPIINNKKEVD